VFSVKYELIFKQQSH